MEMKKDWWDSKPVPEIRFLSELRALVLQRNAKRCPKWKFRLAEDLVMQIQPRTHRLFEVIAVQGGGATVDVFKHHVRGFNELRLSLFGDEGDATWTLKLRRVWWPRPEIFADFQQRVIDGLARFDQFDATMMLQPTCLLCGKALTDPASMARWIGPECAGTSSLEAFGFRLVAAA